ncbi:MAG TPA: serine/threonine-protein kinase, partial [Blastocatellia bacterium]|nr:serine/threonine-protein kinase [Blastocatellia bacterium]
MVEQKRWEQIEELLQAALDLDPDARPAFLRAACDGDNDLRREIESLLARETEAERLDSPDILIANRCGDQTAMSLTGKRIGHYLIERRIGAGGMGVVYRAHDASLDRTVAIKVLPPELSANPARAERLDREARLASALNHPNIVTIHAVGDHAESKFIVSEYVDGRTLRQVLTDPTTGNGRPLDYDKCLDIAIQVASALTAAHTRWIIHRDIKPANIMLRDDGIVKVLDFGIAKLDEPATDPPADTGPLAGASPANPSSGSELTIPGAVIGTASYMSPEQARGEQLDGRTDLFSLGVVLYEMVTGRRLFEGATRAAATRALLRAKNPLPANVRIDSVAGPFEEVIRKCLQFRRDDRYASAAEMLEALELIKKQRAARKSRRMVLLIAGVLVVLALVASVGVAALLSVRYEWEERRLRDGHTAGVRKAALSPDGELLVSVGEDSRIIVWDFVRRTRLATLTDHSAWVVSVAFSPDGKWFVTGGYDRKAIVWDATHFKHAMTLEGHDGPVTGLAFSPDGRLLASASSEEPSDRTILWEVGLWKKIRELPTGAGDWGNILFSHDGNLLISKRYRTDHLWHSRTGQPVDEREASRLPLGTLRSFSPGNGVALSPNEKQAVVVESAGIVRFIDLTHPGANRRLQAHTDHVRAVAYSPDGKLLATGAEDIILWEPATQKVITHFVYPSAVWSVQFSLDARWLVSTHGDGSIVIWDMIERKRAANLNEHIESVRAVAISHDGKRAASA